VSALALNDYQRTTLLRVLERIGTAHPAAWCPCCGAHRTADHLATCELTAAMRWLRHEEEKAA
jgi:hypothetical protein